MANTRYAYKIGGSLEIEAPSYVKRQADEDFYQGLKAGEFCYVLNARQMGKSSLQARAKQRLEAVGVCCAIVDITAIGTTESTAVEWYAGLIDALVSGLGLYGQFDLDAWWEQWPLLSPVQRFSKFLETVLLELLPGSIVIFVDEIDSVRSLPFDADDFFAVIRSVYNLRSTEPKYRRLTFALIGAATPVDLIQDMQRTPFNVGRAIDLAGFRLEETEALQVGLGNARGAMPEILAWTGGQPFLTQKVCQMVVAGTPPNPQFWGDMRVIVGEIVRSRIIENWEGKDDPVHLRTIRGRVLAGGEAQTGRLLGLYQAVLAGVDGIAADDSAEQMQLRLSGLVAQRDGRLQVFNRIYRSVFNQAWVSAELAKLRPAYYGVAIADWLRSGQMDESLLLRGNALRDGLNWAEGKQLSHEDSRFLQVSQAAENRAEKKANQILTTARVQAEKEKELANQALAIVNRKVKRQGAIGGTVLVASLAVAGLAGIGIKQLETQRELILARNTLDKEGTVALRRSGYKQLTALLDAMEAGQEVKMLMQKHSVDGFVASPVYALQSILDLLEDRAMTSLKPTMEKLPTTHAPLQQTLLVSHSAIGDASFSSDGQRIVTDIGLWDANTGQEIAPLKGQEEKPMDGNFRPHGKRTITALANNTVLIRDTGQEMLLKGHTDAILGASFSLDGQRIVTASKDKTARVWSAKTGAEILILRGHEGIIRRASFSPDGQRILTVSGDKTMRIWDVNRSPMLARLGVSSGASLISPDGRRIAAISEEGKPGIWDVITNRFVAIEGYTGSLVGANFSSDGQRLLIPSELIVRIWDTNTGKLSVTLTGHEKKLKMANFSPDGQRIVTASGDRTARVWDGKTGQEIVQLKGHEGWVNQASFSPDGQRIVTTSEDETARIWDAKTGQEITPLKGHRDGKDIAKFSPNGQLILTSIEDVSTENLDELDRKPRIWNADTGEKIAAFKGHESGITAVGFSPDSQRIVTGSSDSTARVWDAKTGQEILVLKGHDEPVIAVSFSADRQQILTASRDKTARVWNAQTGQEIVALRGHEGDVVNVSFSPDRQRIVTASTDKTARIWDAKTGQEIATLRGHSDKLATANFSADGQHIITTSADKTARVWPVETLDVLLVRGCHWLRNYLIANPQTLHRLHVCQTGDRIQAALPNLIAQSERFAREGKTSEAIQGFTIVKQWKPDWPENPTEYTDRLYQEEEVQRKAAQKLAQSAIELGRNGDIEKATSMIQQLQQQHPSYPAIARTWRDLCWYGSTHNQAAKVVFACEAAVKLDPSPIYRDSRGLFYALMGKRARAIEEFNVFIQAPDMPEGRKSQRLSWVRDLQAGKNPFTPDVLKSIQNQ